MNTHEKKVGHTKTFDRTNKVINTALIDLKNLMEKVDSSVMQAYLCDIESHYETIREVYNQSVNNHNELVGACKLALMELRDKSSRYHPAIKAIEEALQKESE